MIHYVYVFMRRALYSIFNLVYSLTTRKIALDFNLLRSLPRWLSDARYACQAALRAREGCQGSVGSTMDAPWMHVAEEGVRAVEGRDLGEGCAGACCVWWPSWPSALGAR